MKHRTQIVVMTCSLLASVAVQPVHAEGAAAAESLYVEGNRLYDAGNFQDACPKYEASLEIDPESIDTRGRLALCYEKIGRLASAWSAWREIRVRARRATGREQAARIAAEHIALLEPQLSYATFGMGGDAPRPGGLIVTIDGKRIPAESFGTPVAIDQGTHRVEVQAPGYQTWSIEVTIARAARRDINMGPLVVDPAAGDETRAISRDAPPARPPRTRLVLAGAAAGLGVIAVGVGAWAGLDSRSKRDEARELGCSDDLSSCPDGPALDTANDAYGRGTLSTVSLIAGAALVAGGAVLWFTAPEHPTSTDASAWRLTPSVGAGQANLALLATW